MKYKKFTVLGNETVIYFYDTDFKYALISKLKNSTTIYKQFNHCGDIIKVIEYWDNGEGCDGIIYSRINKCTRYYENGNLI